MSYSEQEIKVALEVKRILDVGIQEGPWQDNLFLRGIKKKLEELRDRFVGDVDLAQFSEEDKQLTTAFSNNVTEVYISLYQSQGGNIHKWQEIIASLVHYSLGRPIYRDEEDVKAATRLTARNPNNAYVVINVNADAIVPDSKEQPRLDREGRKLITLQEGAITLANVVRLVHTTGHYKLVGNFLVKHS